MHTNENAHWQVSANTTFTLSDDYSTLEIAEQARSDMQAKGITPPDQLVVDDKIHRFGKDKSCWCVFHSDGIPAGAYGDWRTGETYTWCMNIGRELTQTEQAENRERVAEMLRKRDAEKARIHLEAKINANRIWEEATTALEHPYLTHKGIKAHGIKVHKEKLIIPLYNESGEICSLQFIDGDGEKRFLSGGRKRGCFHIIGNLTDKLLICEGFATGASLYEDSGQRVIVAFDAGNLLPVAKNIRELSPDSEIIICGDNDLSGVGQGKAKEAALAIGGKVLIPQIPGADWNDVLSGGSHD